MGGTGRDQGCISLRGDMQPEDIKSRHQKVLSEPKQEPWTKIGEGTMEGGEEGKSKGKGEGGEETEG